MRTEMIAGLSATDPGTRAQALRWLVRHGDAGDAAIVVPLVRDGGEFDDRAHDDPPESARTPVRMVALEALSELREPGMFTEVFDDALEDVDLRVRAQAASGASAAALSTRLSVERDRAVRYRIALALLSNDADCEEALVVLRQLRAGGDLAATAAEAVLNALGSP